MYSDLKMKTQLPHIHDIGVSERVLFNANSAIFSFIMARTS